MEIVQLNSEKTEWKVGDCEVWLHTGKGFLYCWGCSSQTCEHTQAIAALLAAAAKGGVG